MVAAAGHGDWILSFLFHRLDVENACRDITAGVQNPVGERLGNGAVSFDNFTDFVTMGGHGVFVWSCYGIVIAALLVNVFQPIQATRKFRIAQQDAMRQQSQQSSRAEESPPSATTLTESR